MSTTTFSRSGNPDVPTACSLTVTRGDTSAVIIGPNQAMTVANGVWTFGPFTDPTAGIFYTVAMTWTYADGTIGGKSYLVGPTGGDGSLSSGVCQISDQLAENALSPRRASGDSGSAEQHSLPDQIAADRYLAAKSVKKGLGIRSLRLVPPGASDLPPRCF